MLLPCKIWFCRNVPIEMIDGHEGRGHSIKDNKQPWFPALVESIRVSGLASPLLVINGIDGSIHRQTPMRVQCGQNRLLALKELGWKTVPCLITHNIPDGVEGKELHSLEEANSYLRDGRLAINLQSVRVVQTKHPEYMKYPTTSDPYWPE